MLKTKRRRAVVLALIAFFCTAAATYVAVDWKRFGGGILAFFRGHDDQHLAVGGNSGLIGSGGSHSSDLPEASKHSSLPQIASAHPRGAKRIGGGAGKSGDDLFVYGDPAAGIPPGNFIVAANDPAPGGGGFGEGPAPLAGSPAPAPEGGAPAAGGDGGSGGGGGNGPGSSSGGGGGGGDNGFPGGTPTESPAPAPGTPPAPPGPAPSPSDGGPPPAPSPTSAIPEASNLAMMTLGALFLAVAAQRKRSNKSS